MSYADHPILDAEAYTEDTGARGERMQAGEASARAEILATITKRVRMVPVHTLCVPISRDGHIETRMPLTEVFSDRIPYDKPFSILMQIIETVEHPLIDDLLLAVAEEFASDCAHDVGCARGDAP